MSIMLSPELRTELVGKARERLFKNPVDVVGGALTDHLKALEIFEYADRAKEIMDDAVKQMQLTQSVEMPEPVVPEWQPPQHEETEGEYTDDDLIFIATTRLEQGLTPEQAAAYLVEQFGETTLEEATELVEKAREIRLDKVSGRLAEIQTETQPNDGRSKSYGRWVVYDVDKSSHRLRHVNIVEFNGMKLLWEPLRQEDDTKSEALYKERGPESIGIAKVGDPASAAYWPSKDTANMREAMFNTQATTKATKSDYETALEQADEKEEVDVLDYPTDVWKGTPYYDFAMLAHGSGETENNIPLEFFISGLMTYVGAVAGHRITPESNPFMPAHFYTLLRSKRGGSGKSEVMNWCKLCFDGTGLIYQSGFRQHKNIGMYHNDFGSARALIEKFAEYPSILQEYGEFTTAIEKFGITGSGTSFLDFNLNQYDTTRANWSLVKGMKLPQNLPPHINNSMLMATTEERWNETAGRVNLETFIQRMNVVVVDEVRTVMQLWVPDCTEIRRKLLDRIGLLEEYQLQWYFTPEARQAAIDWHEEIQDQLMQDDDSDAAEVAGRLNVFLQRIVGHMALWLCQPPTNPDGTVALPKYVPGLAVPYVQRHDEGPDKIWRAEVTAEMVHRAIQVCEYLARARAKCIPPQGYGKALIENLIKKWASHLRTCRWNALKRRGNLRRYSSGETLQALKNVEAEGLLQIKKNPSNPADQREWVVIWFGDGSTRRKWWERRGGQNRKHIYV